ncbi:MAG: serine/threonine protein kinase [Deltaproteobacteria bacterium]|nr:serine/threonine protein kinase [Deltaproteobacteria bacterium]
MQSLTELKAGRFLGRYELLMPVAQGGMAAVWAARLQGTRGFQKVVAIKTILPTLSDDPRFEQMFLDEAGLASQIRHSNVAQVLDLGEDQGLLYQVMEWIEGPPLSQLVRDSPGGRGLPRPIAAKIMIGVCEGLHAAHEMRDDTGRLVGLVHRDVSPQNILVSIDGVPKVVDFGVAKATSLSSARTATGTFKGKPAYMAPEQILGGEVDRKADVFALGVVLYLITTGKHPFRGDTEMATLHRMVDPKPPPRPSEIVERYPTGLEFVVMKAISKQQNERYLTAADMARALQQAVPEVQDVGDTDVAACVRELSGAGLKSRSESLKRALAEADQRNPVSGRGSSPSFNPVPEHVAIEILSADIQTDPRGPSVAPLDVGTPSQPVSATPARPAPRRSKVLPAVFAVVAFVSIAIVVAAVLTWRARRLPPIAAAQVPSAPASSTPPAASEAASASPDPSASGVALDALPRAPVDPEQPRTAGGFPREKARDAGAIATPEPSAKTPSKGYVPSIRDPGF